MTSKPSEQMKIVPVRWIDEVLDLALERPLTPRQAGGDIPGKAREPDPGSDRPGNEPPGARH